MNITVTPKLFALFFLEALDFAMSAVSDTRRPASQQVRGSREGVEWGVGVSTECLFAVVLWVSGGSPTVQNFLLGST